MSSRRFFFVRYLQVSGVSSLQNIYEILRIFSLQDLHSFSSCVFASMHIANQNYEIIFIKNIYNIKFKAILNSGFLHFSLLKGLSLEFQVINPFTKKKRMPNPQQLIKCRILSFFQLEKCSILKISSFVPEVIRKKLKKR